ncbi:18536_t:CDS:2, partial [Acaulospora morrowiae]
SFSIELKCQEDNIQKELQLSERLTKKQNKEIRDKCSVNEYLKLSSQFFVDPTIFCLLRQYHSGTNCNTGSPTLSLPSLPVQPDSASMKKKSKGKNKEPLFSTQNQTKTIPQKRNIDYLKSGNKGHKPNSINPTPLSNTTDTSNNSDNLQIKQNSMSFGYRDSKPRFSSSNKNSSDHTTSSCTEHGSSIRPEPSALELRFWEMAKELDNSPLASLKEENRVKVPKIRTEMNYIASKNYKGSSKPQNIVNKLEVILSVAFYNQNKPATRMQEFLVLGSQPLTALRDAFYCLRDFYKVTPWEQPTKNVITNLTDKKTSSSYFFIENVFYNDLRDPRAIDYSKNIIEWVKEKNLYKQRGLGLYSSKKMEEMTFIELSIRLNYPYLFVHQGNCQHAVVFRDLRIMQPYDEQDLSAYPKAIFRGKINRHKCRMCMQRPTLLVTINDFISGESPAYFCDPCYYQFHYNSKNELLYDNFQ